MQVSIACTEQNLRSRSSEDRLCGPRPGPGGGNGAPVGGGHGNPPGGGGSGPKARAAVVTRTLAPAGALRESTRRATGMKYRYGGGRVAHSICSLFPISEATWDALRTPSNFAKKVPAHSISSSPSPALPLLVFLLVAIAIDTSN